MRTFFNFTQRHPAVYITGCCAVGLAVRFHMAGGDLGLFLNPLFPLFR